LRRLDDDSDDDFDGYVDEEEVSHTNELGECSFSDRESISSLEDTDGIPEFLASSGCTQDTTSMSPLELFSLLVNDSMLEEVVKQTNIFQHFLDSENVPPKSRANLWCNKTHDIHELKEFLCIIIIMGLVHYPCIEDYWSTTWPFKSDAISSIMKRDRFCLLLRFLHLNDNSRYIQKGLDGHDPLYKIKPFTDAFLHNLKAAYIPGREISVDESMIGFKGRLGFLQYAPKKPTKWGLKAYVLADSLSGFNCNWILYTGT